MNSWEHGVDIIVTVRESMPQADRPGPHQLGQRTTLTACHLANQKVHRADTCGSLPPGSLPAACARLAPWSCPRSCWVHIYRKVPVLAINRWISDRAAFNWHHHVRHHLLGLAATADRVVDHCDVPLLQVEHGESIRESISATRSLGGPVQELKAAGTAGTEPKIRHL